MPRREIQAIAAAATAAVAIFLVLAALRPEPFVLLFFGAEAAAVVVLGILFLPKFPVREVHATPEASLAFLARHFRFAGQRVSEVPGTLTVRIGSFSAVRITARPTATGSDIRYHAYATPSGWGTIIIFILLGWTAFLGLALAIYGFLRVLSFVASRLIPAVPVDGELPVAPPEDETRAVLLEALSEAHRVAAEAHEAIRSTYWDFQSIVIGGAIIAWLILFVVIFPGLPEPDFARRVMTGFALAGAYTVTYASVFAWGVRRRFRPRVVAYRDRAVELERTFSREVARTHPTGGESSSFEILAEASKEVPVWIEATRRPRLSREPAAGVLIVMVVFITYSLISGALAFAYFDPLVAFLLAAGGAALVAATIWLYRKWRRRWDTETVRILDVWKQRFAEVRARMDRYLEDL